MVNNEANKEYIIKIPLEEIGNYTTFLEINYNPLNLAIEHVNTSNNYIIWKHQLSDKVVPLSIEKREANANKYRSIWLMEIENIIIPYSSASKDNYLLEDLNEYVSIKDDRNIPNWIGKLLNNMVLFNQSVKKIKLDKLKPQLVKEYSERLQL